MKKAIGIIFLISMFSFVWGGCAATEETDLFYAAVVSYNYYISPGVLNKTPEELTDYDVKRVHHWMNIPYEEEALAREIAENEKYYPSIWLRCELTVLTEGITFRGFTFDLGQNSGIWAHDFYETWGLEEVPPEKNCGKYFGARIVVINIEGKSEKEITEMLRQTEMICKVSFNFLGSEKIEEITIPVDMSALHRDTRQEKDGYRIKMTDCEVVELVDVTNPETLKGWHQRYPVDYLEFMKNAQGMKFYRCRLKGTATKNSVMKVLGVTFWCNNETAWAIWNKTWQSEGAYGYCMDDMYEDGTKEMEIFITVGVPDDSDLQTEIRKLDVEIFYAVDWVGYMDNRTLTGPMVSTMVDMSEIEVRN